MLVLYTTLGCHLCDKAKQLIYSTLGFDQHIHECDIADDEALLTSYALKIPVLAWRDKKTQEEHELELQWPFDDLALVAWLEKVKGD